MVVHVNRDMLIGFCLALFGAAIAIYAYAKYPIGSIFRMGPGMFPVMLGCASILLAIAIALRSHGKQGDPIEINVRAAAFILVALAVFAIIIEPFGVVPALLALLVISSGAVPGRTIVGTAIFSIVITACIVFIFVYLMNLNLNLFGWPA